MAALNAAALLGAAVDHALRLGLFEKVNQHEPKAAPGKGLSAAVWVQRLQPVRSSGLASTSVRVELRERLYTSMIQDPQDGIDPNLLDATDALMAAYSADFTLGSLVRSVDLLGAHGDPLSAQAGYLNQDGQLLRVMDITLPLLVNDLWEQVP